MALDIVGPMLLEAGRILHAVDVPVAVHGSCGFPSCVVRKAPERFQWNPRSHFDEVNLAQREFDTEACRTCAMTAWCSGVRTPYLQKHCDRGVVPFPEVPEFLQKRSAELRRRD